MISAEQLVLRLLVAAVLGALVGLERERLEWAAGMRTHALVSLGSALFMVVSIFGFSDILNEQHVILDPSRVAAQVASGIGFIWAGTIIFRREVVKGLTTAASIWSVAAVGLAVGGGMFLAARFATLLALALLVLAKPLKARMFPNRKEARRLRLIVERGTPLAELREEIEASEVPLERIVVRSRLGLPLNVVLGSTACEWLGQGALRPGSGSDMQAQQRQVRRRHQHVDAVTASWHYSSTVCARKAAVPFTSPPSPDRPVAATSDFLPRKPVRSCERRSS
jgi:putative Mg2+ transporter-C (MgtC) family protein